MRRIASIRLVTLLAVIMLLALVAPPGSSGTVLATIPPDCGFFGVVAVCGKFAPEGTTVTARVHDPIAGPAWSTTAYLHGGRLYYFIEVPPEIPGVQEGGVEGQEVFFSVTVTYDCDCPDAASVTGTLQAPSSVWQWSTPDVIHHLLVGQIGDANLDGKFDVADWVAAEKMATGELCKTPCADVTGDGDVTLLDWIAIYNMLFGPPAP